MAGKIGAVEPMKWACTGLLYATLLAGCESATATKPAAPPPSEPLAPRDTSCPAPTLPSDDPFVLDAGAVDVHVRASATGTQNYMCQETASDCGPSFGWKLVGPDALLSDCNSRTIGRHFPSDSGPPEWQANDNSYVIAQKTLAYAPDGGAGSVPWLVLKAVQTGGDGLLAHTSYVERLHTRGGVAPEASACTADSRGAMRKVPYTAEYYFIGP